MQEFDTKKLYVFFWNFTRKGIEKLCSIDLSSIPKTQKNELTICPQDEFEFVEYLVDNDTQKYKSFDIPKQAHFSAEKMVENFVNSSKKQIVLTNYPACISSLLGQVACGKIGADDIVLYYRGNGIETKYYTKRDEINNVSKAYFIDESGKEIGIGDNVVACVSNNKSYISYKCGKLIK